MWLADFGERHGNYGADEISHTKMRLPGINWNCPTQLETGRYMVQISFWEICRMEMLIKETDGLSSVNLSTSCRNLCAGIKNLAAKFGSPHACRSTWFNLIIFLSLFPSAIPLMKTLRETANT